MTARTIGENNYIPSLDGDRYAITENVTQNQLIAGKHLATILDKNVLDSLDPLIDTD